ncbi:MAG TPA: hypothetical protein VHR64_13465 [Thermomicrobiales bacterium]|nr:hypothetical protein [Thermomicrobiales bacterium]
MNTEVQVVAWTRRYAFSLSPAEEGRASLSARPWDRAETRVQLPWRSVFG